MVEREANMNAKSEQKEVVMDDRLLQDSKRKDVVFEGET